VKIPLNQPLSSSLYYALEITKVQDQKQMQWFVYSFLVFDFWALRLYFWRDMLLIGEL